MQQGDSLYRKEAYRAALNKYNAARTCDRSKGELVDQAVSRLFDAIEKNKKEAVDAKNQAVKEKQRAEAALRQVEIITADVVDMLLRDADKDILALNYTDALAKIHNAARLVKGKTGTGPLAQRRPAVGRAVMEMAFFFAETNRPLRAGVELRLADSLLHQGRLSTWTRTPPADSTTQLAKYRETLVALDQEQYHAMYSRYYPDMVTVPGGTFWMGDENGEADETEHQVTLDSFSMGRTEVTIWQYNLYRQAIGKNDIENTIPGGWIIIGSSPVVNVSWYDAAEYLNWLSVLQGLRAAYKIEGGEVTWDTTANGYRLPTEAEWEFAAGGGITDRDAEGRRKYVYAGSDSLEQVAWYNENSGNRTRPVAGKKPNGLGLYDMSGNVWEWCWDWYGEYEAGTQTNPTGPPSGAYRVIRGGGWFNDATRCRVAVRFYDYPDVRFSNIGFRPSRTP